MRKRKVGGVSEVMRAVSEEQVISERVKRV